MLKVQIKRQSNVTHEAQFTSQAEVDQWVAQCEAVEAWGKPERPELDEAGQPTGVILPAEYTIEIEDVTAQLEQELTNAVALSYLASTDWYVTRQIETGIPVPEDIASKRAEMRAMVIR